MRRLADLVAAVSDLLFSFPKGPQVCGITHVADHFTMTVDPAAFDLAYIAIRNAGVASVAKFNKAECTFLVDDVLSVEI